MNRNSIITGYTVTLWVWLALYIYRAISLYNIYIPISWMITPQTSSNVSSGNLLSRDFTSVQTGQSMSKDERLFHSCLRAMLSHLHTPRNLSNDSWKYRTSWGLLGDQAKSTYNMYDSWRQKCMEGWLRFPPAGCCGGWELSLKIGRLKIQRSKLGTCLRSHGGGNPRCTIDVGRQDVLAPMDSAAKRFSCVYLFICIIYVHHNVHIQSYTHTHDILYVPVSISYIQIWLRDDSCLIHVKNIEGGKNASGAELSFQRCHAVTFSDNM